LKLLLKDFQEEYVSQLVGHMRRAAAEADSGLQAVVFSSPTGSGKTVMAAAAIERILRGDEEHEPDSLAIFLWVSDQPEINEQTRRKILEASSDFDESRLVTVDATFDEEMFPPGKIYFLNTQKLGKEKQLVTRGDERSFTVWESVTKSSSVSPFIFREESASCFDDVVDV
jgi:type III restriction enzyme